MITSSGKVLEYHGQRYCVTCKQTGDHTCFSTRYRKSESSHDSYCKEERWNCDICHTDKVIVKEIPIPTEKTMLVKLLMSLSEKYELEGTTITVGSREVRAVFRFPEHDLRKLREIAENWADRGYITAKNLLKLEKAGMRDVAKIPPRWASSKRELSTDAPRNLSTEQQVVVMAELPKERTRLRAVDAHHCKHPKLIPIHKYKRYTGKVFCKCLVCHREMVKQAGTVSSATVTSPPRATRQQSNSAPV